jgi:hypothetical protein
VAPEATDMSDRDPAEVDLETVLSLELLSRYEEDFRQDLRGQARDLAQRVPT